MRQTRINARREAPSLYRFIRRVGSVLVLAQMTACSVIEQQGVVLPEPAQKPPPAAPRALGADTLDSAQKKRLMSLFGGEYHWPSAENYLNQILARLATAEPASSPAYHITILNTGAINAFALPSGDLFVTRGLLTLANDGAEAAAVMAHEIAHVSARHAFLRAEQEKRAALITQAAQAIQSREKGAQAQTTSAQTIARFSRQQEFDADRIGVNVLHQAGFDPFGAQRFLMSLSRAGALRNTIAGQAGSEKPDLLASHPSSPERIVQATAAARQLAAPGVGDRQQNEYFSAINGMGYGDDPADGAIRGRKFIHTRLGFAFEAPEGFSLENASQAIIGYSAGGAEYLRLDSVRASQAGDLQKYLSTGWIDGLIPSSIVATEVNGLPAAMASARAGDWNFKVAVISFDGDVYRIIYAVKALTEEAERKFIASIRTFRALHPGEATALPPLRISIVTAGVLDSAEKLAARMAVDDHPLERFMILNGLESASVRSGQRYKLIVVEK